MGRLKLWLRIFARVRFCQGADRAVISVRQRAYSGEGARARFGWGLHYSLGCSWALLGWVRVGWSMLAAALRAHGGDRGWLYVLWRDMDVCMVDGDFSSPVQCVRRSVGCSMAFSSGSAPVL